MTIFCHKKLYNNNIATQILPIIITLNTAIRQHGNKNQHIGLHLSTNSNRLLETVLLNLSSIIIPKPVIISYQPLTTHHAHRVDHAHF